MPTVSDIIAIKLQLDSSGLTVGSQQALAEVARVKTTLKDQGDQLERIAKSIGENIFTALRGVANLMGIVLTFEGFKQIVLQATEAGTSLGRFSEAVEVSATRIGELEQAFQRAGGRSEEVRPIIAKMKSDIMAVRMGRPQAEWMNMLGLAPFGMGGLQYRSPDDILLEVARKAQGMPATQLGQFLPGLPVSPENLTVLTQPNLLRGQLGAVGAVGTAPTPPQVEAAERLRDKFATLEQLNTAVLRDLVTLTEPLLTGVMDFIIGALGWLDGIERKLIGSTTGTAAGGGMIGARPGFGGYRPNHGGAHEPVGPRGPAGAIPTGSITAVGGGPPSAFIVHHTGGRGDVSGVQATLQQRGLGVQYVMDREGNITQIGGPGSSHMMTGWGAGQGLSNRNTVGMEVIARDDKDVTPAQIAAAQRFIAERYPNTPVFGHGEVNPGHKEADEGMSIVDTIRRQRQGSGVRGSTFNDTSTASGRSAATTPGIAIPSGGKMGDWYEVTTPDGRKFRTQLIDRGPAARTGRGVDISAPLAAQMGYGKDFPTDARFGVRPLSGPSPSSLLQVPNVGVGAAAAAQAPRPENRVINNESAASINHVEVHTNATDAAGIAKDVKEEIGRQLAVPSFDERFTGASQ